MYHTSQYFFMKNIAKKGSRCGANFLQLLVARQFLLVAPYFLFVTFCSLIVTFCLLLVTFLLDACYILLVTHYFLLVSCYFLLVSCYCWFIVPFFSIFFLTFCCSYTAYALINFSVTLLFYIITSSKNMTMIRNYFLFRQVYSNIMQFLVFSGS